MRRSRAVRWAPVVALVIGVGVVLAGCGGSTPTAAPNSSTTSSSRPSASTSTASTTKTTTTPPPSVALSPPPVPTGSVYVGAWVNPNHTPGTGIEVSGSQEVAQLPGFTSSVGGNTPRILHVYTKFKAPVPMSTVDAIAAAGAVPLIDWGCTDLQAIVSGQDDSVIQQHAQTLKSYGKPVFLRWYWEFNQDNASGRLCGGFDNPAAYITAWQHIWTIFHDTGASNVAFVWCPGLAGGNYAAYYPGDQDVDWIGIDGYDRSFKGVGAGDFNGIFGGFYSEWVGHGKPMMVAETGATGAEQAPYIESIQNQAPSLPQFKAIIYFDAIGPRADWALQGGTSAFEALLTDPYFSFKAS